MRTLAGRAGVTGGRGLGGLLVLSSPVTATAWAAMPGAETELLGLARRFPADLSACTQWRLVGMVGAVAGVAGAVLRAKYATTAGGALVDMGIPGDLAIDVTGAVKGAWTAIPAGAIADTFLAVVGFNGNGIVSPTFDHIALEVR